MDHLSMIVTFLCDCFKLGSAVDQGLLVTKLFGSLVVIWSLSDLKLLARVVNESYFGLWMVD